MTPERAEALIGAVQGSRLLDGWRGRPALDRGALVAALCKVSEFAVALGEEVESIEINPFLVRVEGAVALDALIARRG